MNKTCKITKNSHNETFHGKIVIMLKMKQPRAVKLYEVVLKDNATSVIKVDCLVIKVNDIF